jgi:hypothetical protein
MDAKKKSQGHDEECRDGLRRAVPRNATDQWATGESRSRKNVENKRKT